MTNSGPQDSLLPAPHQQLTPTEAVPSFIDPSQIFNPYFEGCGRRKREAAEAEAEAQARRNTTEQSAEELAQNPETQSQIAVTSDSAAHRLVASSASAPERPDTAGKGKEKSTRSDPRATTSLQTGNPSQTTSDADADMASEMKAMIERMRE